MAQNKTILTAESNEMNDLRAWGEIIPKYTF